jgi:hypothetical protein
LVDIAPWETEDDSCTGRAKSWVRFMMRTRSIQRGVVAIVAGLTMAGATFGFATADGAAEIVVKPNSNLSWAPWTGEPHHPGDAGAPPDAIERFDSLHRFGADRPVFEPAVRGQRLWVFVRQPRHDATKQVGFANADGSLTPTAFTIAEGGLDGVLGTNPGPIYAKIFDPASVSIPRRTTRGRRPASPSTGGRRRCTRRAPAPR